MKLMRKIMIVVILCTLLYQIGTHLLNDSVEYNEQSASYFIENGFEETNSKNIVTAIYLDYRLFDSFFEASILLVAVTGIAFMAIKDEELY